MPTTKPSSPRLGYLDALKGDLVLLMVLYHSLNYSSQYYLGFRYLSFLPPSFIVITGFLISYIYLARYQPRDWKLHSKLLARGFKLLALFTVLNVAVALVRGPYAGGEPIGLYRFIDSWDLVYLLGSGRSAVFEVLLPIAYLLILAPGLIIANALHRVVLPLITLAVIGLCVWTERYGGSGNLNLISAGIVGFLLGKYVTQPQRLRRFWPLTTVAYIAYFVVGLSMGHNYLVQLLGACVALAALCALNVRWGDGSWIQARLIRLGQYSLLSYIAQIFILQALSFFIHRPAPWSPLFFLLMLGCLLLTTAVVEVTHWLRQHSRICAWLYTAVFP